METKTINAEALKRLEMKRGLVTEKNTIADKWNMLITLKDIILWKPYCRENSKEGEREADNDTVLRQDQQVGERKLISSQLGQEIESIGDPLHPIIIVKMAADWLIHSVLDCSTPAAWAWEELCQSVVCPIWDYWRPHSTDSPGPFNIHSPGVYDALTRHGLHT